MSDGFFYEIIQNVFFLVLYFISLSCEKKDSSCAAALGLSLLSPSDLFPIHHRDDVI